MGTNINASLFKYEIASFLVMAFFVGIFLWMICSCAGCFGTFPSEGIQGTGQDVKELH
jgi:hypothetical protein